VSPRAWTEPRPDWAIVGWRDADLCWVLASTELTHGELEAVREDEMWDLSTFDTRATSMRYEVHLGIRTYVVASGPTYASALAAAMGRWNPDQPDTKTPAIDHRKAVEQ
jgi:predicted HD phosphohydrolase